MAGADIQAAICGALTPVFEQGMVVPEWNMRKGSTDSFLDAATYAPRLDVAVGPFNLTRQFKERDAARIHGLRHRFVEKLKIVVARQNHGGIFYNRNPRCLIAIEVEDSTSSKHILGGITNVSMLGMLGVVVGSTARIAKVRRIHEYACRLKQVEKAHDDMFGNVACFEEREFIAFIRGR